MKQNNKFVTRTWLEEAVFNIAEADVNFFTLLRNESKTILVNLQVSESFLANKVWPNS